MNYLPDVYKRFRQQFPDVANNYDSLAVSCHSWGPLDEKTRQLVKLGIAIGMSSEGATRSHTRRAMDTGASPDEIRHVVLLALTTTGFPAMVAAMKWVDEVLDKSGA